MTEDTALIEKREELKRQLAAGKYKTLFDVMLDGTGRLIQKLTRNPEPPSFWYSAVVVALVALLIDFLVSILLGEFNPLRRETVPADLAVAGLILATVIAVKIGHNISFTALREDLLDAIESVADVTDLQHLLATLYNVKKPLSFGLAFGIFVGVYLPIVYATIRAGFAGFGPTILTAILGFVGGVSLYYFPLLLALAGRLSRYQFNLYTADPSSSEIISRLSGMLSSMVNMFAVLAAIYTLIFVVFGLLVAASIVFLALLVWGPLVAFFAANQIALGKIITRAKWRTLNEIQAQVERVRTQEDIPSEKTLEHLGKLMDYHDRIKATRNSALDLRTVLKFLNSLLLPLLAFLLANLDKIFALFS